MLVALKIWNIFCFQYMRNCSGAKRSFPVSTNSQNGALGQTGRLNLPTTRMRNSSSSSCTWSKIRLAKSLNEKSCWRSAGSKTIRFWWWPLLMTGDLNGSHRLSTEGCEGQSQEAQGHLLSCSGQLKNPKINCNNKHSVSQVFIHILPRLLIMKRPQFQPDKQT